jgi:opacity protein-like surface antigen
MSRARILGLAGAAALLSTASLAADLVPPPPLPPPVYQPPVVAVTSGWYLRGFVGASNEFLSEVTHPIQLMAPQFSHVDWGGFDAAPFGGGGFGYQWNNWLRVDATLEYRGKANFHAMDRFFNPFTGIAGTFNTDVYTASKSELVGLVNVFLDLGTWWCVTPFIGAGAGFAKIKIDHFVDINPMAGGGGFADSGTKTNFAWALQAGVAYKVNPNFAVELSYRYLNVGNGETGTLLNMDPTQAPNPGVVGLPLAPFTFNKIQSHDIMLGVRWLLQPEGPGPMPPPLMRKG